MNLKGKLLVMGKRTEGVFDYQVLQKLEEYKIGSKIIIIPRLDPDYTLLLNNIDIIISPSGSQLSHLSIVSREYGKTIILCEDIQRIDKKRGKLRIKLKKQTPELQVL
jgi:hypothetical protein